MTDGCGRCADIPDVVLATLRLQTKAWTPADLARFTPTEARLAFVLSEHVGEWVPTYRFVDREGWLDTAALRSNVYRMRKKLRPGMRIETNFKGAYRLIIDETLQEGRAGGLGGVVQTPHAQRRRVGRDNPSRAE